VGNKQRGFQQQVEKQEDPHMRAIVQNSAPAFPLQNPQSNVIKLHEKLLFLRRKLFLKNMATN
jgi:hypothetical protein